MKQQKPVNLACTNIHKSFLGKIEPISTLYSIMRMWGIRMSACARGHTWTHADMRVDFWSIFWSNFGRILVEKNGQNRTLNTFLLCFCVNKFRCRVLNTHADARGRTQRYGSPCKHIHTHLPTF